MAVIGKQRPAASQQTQGQADPARQRPRREGLQSSGRGLALPAPGSGLDHICERNKPQYVLPRESLERVAQRGGVVAHAQLERGQRTLHSQDLVFVPSRELAQQPGGQRTGIRFLPPPGQSPQLLPGVGAQDCPVTRRLRQRPPLRQRGLGIREAALLYLDAQLDAERCNQRRNCAPVTQFSHPPLLHLVPGRVVVQQIGGLAHSHEVRQGIVGDRLAGGQRRDGPAKQGSASLVAALAHGREAVQQQVVPVLVKRTLGADWGHPRMRPTPGVADC